MDGYFKTIELKSNIVDCFTLYAGTDNDSWYDDFVDIMYRESRDLNIKYKDFVMYLEYDAHEEDILYVVLKNDAFTEWRDDREFIKFLSEVNTYKDVLIQLINTELIDKVNDICAHTALCKFPTVDYTYNPFDKSFYVRFNTVASTDTMQVKYEHIDDIDFEDF